MNLLWNDDTSMPTSETEDLAKNNTQDDDIFSKETESMSSDDTNQQQMAKAKALSMSFMKSFSGLGCSCDDDCYHDPFKSIQNHEINKENDESTKRNHNYRKSISNGLSFSEYPSTISPLVVAPMMSKNLESQNPGSIETMIAEYMCFCRFYKVHYNAGILTNLRFSAPSLRPSGAFHDSDMLALVELLLRHANGALKHVVRLDFSVVGKEGKHERNSKLIGFTSHGALSLAKALQTTKYIRQVFLPRNRIGPYGATALFMACHVNPSIEDLNLRRCNIDQRGALAFCEIILLGMTPSEETDQGGGIKTTGHGLVNVNLSLNHIGHHGTSSIENLMKERGPGDHLVVNLDGNLVFPEIMNAVTHCAGVVMSIIGGRLLSLAVRDTSFTHRISCAIYTGSLLSLYLSSTLFHSFFATVNTRRIFRVMDKCAIYILIAGSYTPFMQVLLNDQPLYSFGLLGFIWTCCILGVSVEAMYPDWKHRNMFSLAMYMGMGVSCQLHELSIILQQRYIHFCLTLILLLSFFDQKWCCVVCLPQMVARSHVQCVYMILLGGAAYTAGVPFYVRNNNLDHALWHLFVMAGSIIHWLAVYLHVSSTPLYTHDMIQA